MTFDPDKFLSEDDEIRRKKVVPKDQEVAEEVSGMRQYLQNIINGAPDAVPLSSGFRTPEKNALVGGIPTSFHPKGEAFDLRRLGDQSKNIEYFRSKGMKQIPESDHDHFEPPPGFKIPAFDPDQFLRDEGIDLSEEAEFPDSSSSPIELGTEGEIEMYPGDPKKDLLDPAWAGLRKFTQASTAGLSEPLAAGIAAPIAQHLIEKDPSFDVLPKKSLKDTYKSIRKQSKEDLANLEEENPVSSFGGEITGYANPKGAFSGLGKLAGKGIEAIPALSKIPGPLLQKTAKAGLEGGLTNLAYQTIHPDSGDGPVEDFAFGYTAALIPPLQAGKRKTGEFLKKQIDTGVLPNKIQGALESIPLVGGWLKGGREAEEIAAKKAFKESESLRKAEFKKGASLKKETFKQGESMRKGQYLAEREVSREGVKAVPGVDDIGSGKALGEASKTGQIELGKQYEKTVEPIMKRYSLKKISPEKVRESVLSTLKRQGLVDKKGNILVEEIESILSPERKSFTKKLVEISDAIQKNPSVRKMQNILRDLDNLANFGAKNRSSEQRMFGNISRSAKEAFFDSMEGIAKPKDVEALRAARKTYATKKPMYERLESATFADPEKVVKGAGSQLTGSMIKDTVAAIPELKKPLGDVVIANIVKRGTTPQSLSRAIDEFGRDTLKQILDDDTFKKLMDAEKRFHVSRKPFVRGEAPKVEPFTPRQMPDPEMAKIYKWLSGFLGKPARGGQFGKSIGPILQAGKKYGEQVF